MDIEYLNLPTWVWRYLSASGGIQIFHVEKKLSTSYYWINLSYYVDLSNEEFSIDNEGFRYENSQLRKCESFKNYEFSYKTLKSIFNVIDQIV